jgi:hypothetical protein
MRAAVSPKGYAQDGHCQAAPNAIPRSA